MIKESNNIMQKSNIFRQMYKYSPLNFYALSDDKTVIRSVNNTSLAYEYLKAFTEEEIKSVWSLVKFYKRISTVLIFVLFIFLLYEFIFPQYSFLVNNSWYVNALIMLAVIAVVCQVTTVVCTKVFEKNLIKKFGQYKKVKFKPSDEIDEKYYNMFKMEVVKVLVVIIVLISGFAFVSPFDIAKKLLHKGHYRDVVKITTIGAKVFPIAQEWYAMRGYANYKLDNYQDAINDFDAAYKLGAEGFNIMNFDNKIFIKYSLKDYEGALADFDNEIKNSDNDSEKDEFLWDKAQFLYNIGKYEEALGIYSELIEKAENDRIFLLKDRLYFERAQVYKKLNKDEQYKSDIAASGIADNETEIENSIPKPVLMLDEETFESY